MTDMQLSLFGRACAECGEDVSHRGANAKRCQPCSDQRRRAITRGCQQRYIERARAQRRSVARSCADCGGSISHRKGDTVTCEPCRTTRALASSRASHQRQRERVQDERLSTPRPCVDCGADIAHRRSDTNRCAACAKELKRGGNRVYALERYRSGHRQPRDPDRDRENQRERRRRDPARAREYNLKRTYGISLGEYEALFASQNNACAICGTTVPGGRGWHVDHCHDTGEIRGVLCGNCNVGIGQLQDSPPLLLRAFNYLNRTKAANG